MSDPIRTAPVSSIALLLVLMTMPLPAATPSDGPSWWPTALGWQEQQRLTPNDVQDPPFHLMFGSQVAIDGDTLVTSTQLTLYNDNGLSCDEIGHDDGCDWVYVFERGPEGTWQQAAKLTPENPVVGDSFGFALALDAESGVIVVGNPGVDVQANEVYIFERGASGMWDQTARLNWTNPNPPLGAFGTTVAVHGHTVAVPVGFPGKTLVFEKGHTGDWKHAVTLEGAASPLGVGLGQDTLIALVIERHPYCAEPQAFRPQYQVYDRIDGNWTPTVRLDPSAQFDGETTIGTRYALNKEGTILVIGAAVDHRVYGVPTEVCATVEGPPPVGKTVVQWGGPARAVGSAWIYERQGDEWVMTADVPNPTPNVGPVMDGSFFGISVDASANKVVVGADCDYYNAGFCSGAGFVYEKQAGDWTLSGRLRIQGAQAKDGFGHAVGVSEGTVVAGAFATDRVGSVHLFERFIRT